MKTAKLLTILFFSLSFLFQLQQVKAQGDYKPNVFTGRMDRVGNSNNSDSTIYVEFNTAKDSVRIRHAGESWSPWYFQQTTTSATPNYITVTDGDTNPILSIVTSDPTISGTSLATGDQIYSFTDTKIGQKRISIQSKDSTNNVRYGYLYNYFAAIDPRKISSSDDWVIPTYEFSTLQQYLDPSGDFNSNNAGSMLKEKGTDYWQSPNSYATNEVGFNGRGNGQRNEYGTFAKINQRAIYWCLGTLSSTYGRAAHLEYQTNRLDGPEQYVSNTEQMVWGASIRLVNPNTALKNGETGIYIGNDGHVYHTVCIGTQEWLSEDLLETKYRNGDAIPQVQDGTTWGSLSTGAWCSYSNTSDYSYTYGPKTSQISLSSPVVIDTTLTGSATHDDPLRVNPNYFVSKETTVAGYSLSSNVILSSNDLTNSANIALKTDTATTLLSQHGDGSNLTGVLHPESAQILSGTTPTLDGSISLNAKITTSGSPTFTVTNVNDGEFGFIWLTNGGGDIFNLNMAGKSVIWQYGLPTTTNMDTTAGKITRIDYQVSGDSIMISFTRLETQQPDIDTLLVERQLFIFPDSSLTPGTGKNIFFYKNDIKVVDVGAYIKTAGTGTTKTQVDINSAGSSILSTPITIDSNEKTSEKAAISPVVSADTIYANMPITFDLDSVGSTTAGNGLWAWIQYLDLHTKTILPSALLNSLMLDFEFNEATVITVADSSGNGYDGTNYGATVNNNPFGDADLSYYMTGGNDSISIPYNTAFNFYSGTANIPFSAHAVIQPDVVTSTHHCLIGQNNSWYFRIRSTGNLSLIIYGSGGGYIMGTGNTALSPSTRYDVACTWDGTDVNGIKLYVNGSEETVTPTTSGTFGHIAESTRTMIIGAYDGGQYYQGYLASIRAWKDRILSINAVDSLYNAGSYNPIENW